MALLCLEWHGKERDEGAPYMDSSALGLCSHTPAGGLRSRHSTAECTPGAYEGMLLCFLVMSELVMAHWLTARPYTFPRSIRQEYMQNWQK